MIKDSLKQIFTYGTGTVAQSALAFILLPLYLRFFEPAEYGVVSLLLVVVSLLNLFANAGMVSGLHMLYYEAEAGERKKLVFTTLIWYVCGAGVFVTALVIAAPYLSGLLFHTGDYAYAVRLVGGIVFFSMLMQIPLVVFRLEKKAKHYVAFSLLKFIADFGLKLVFIVSLGRGVNGYFESAIIVNAVVLCSVLPFTMKFISLSFNMAYLKRLLRLGFPFVFSAIAVWTLGMSDRLILNHFSGASEVGIYSLANNFAFLFNILLTSPFGLFWTPFFLSFAAERPTEDIKALFAKLIRYMFLIGSILVLAISLGSGDVLRIFTDLFSAKAGYLEASKLVPLLTLGVFFHFLNGLFAGPLFVVKRPKIVAVASLISSAANLGLNFLLIPRLGAVGAALTTAFAHALFMVIIYIWVQRFYPVNYRWWQLSMGFLFLIVSFAIGWQIDIAQPWISLFARVIAGAGLFLLAAWFLSDILKKTERQNLLRYLRLKLRVATVKNTDS
ncbi:polysaccharide biosynthesis C-terminal domain-containing protein [Chloroflexota bacterium]